MSENLRGPCSAWATIEDIELMPGFSPDDQIEPQVKLDALEAATQILYRLSGQQFPGICEITVRPCRKASWNNFFVGWSFNYPVAVDPLLWTSPYGWGVCTCGTDRMANCGCGNFDQIKLGAYPLISITQVKVDGLVLDPSKYRIDDWRYLVRLDGQGWPSCQDLSVPATTTNTFEVTFKYGHSIGADAKHACARLAYELAKAYKLSDNCLLPERIQSVTRQGMSMVVIDPMNFFDNGRTGIYEIDLWLSSVNPHGRRESAVMISPDVSPAARRVST